MRDTLLYAANAKAKLTQEHFIKKGRIAQIGQRRAVAIVLGIYSNWIDESGGSGRAACHGDNFSSKNYHTAKTIHQLLFNAV
jgi:hypothetical protein